MIDPTHPLPIKRQAEALEMARSTVYALPRQISGHPVGAAWQIHNIIGSKFFDWVRSEKQCWTRIKIEDEYSKRVISFLNDVMASKSSLANSAKTILLSGGNPGFVSTSAVGDIVGCNVRSLSALQNEIDTNLLSLIGLHRLAFSDSVRIASRIRTMK